MSESELAVLEDSLHRTRLNRIDPQSSGPSLVGEDVLRFREICLLEGVLFEIRSGMRLTRSAPKCSTIIRKEYGFKGWPLKLAQQLFEDMKKRGVLVDSQ